MQLVRKVLILCAASTKHTQEAPPLRLQLDLVLAAYFDVLLYLAQGTAVAFYRENNLARTIKVRM